MLRQIVRGATFQRDAYLRAVIGTNGTGDAVIIVVAVFVTLGLTITANAITDILGHARFILGGGFGWLILSGLIYLLSRHWLRGDGSFQGVLAMTGLAYPVMVLLVAAQVGERIPLALRARPTLLLFKVIDLDFPAAIITILATVWFLGILAAGTRVAMSLSLDRALMAVGAGYAAWWVVASLFRL